MILTIATCKMESRYATGKRTADKPCMTVNPIVGSELFQELCMSHSCYGGVDPARIGIAWAEFVSG